MQDHLKSNWKQKLAFTRLHCFFAHISSNSDILHHFVPALFTIQLPPPFSYINISYPFAIIISSCTMCSFFFASVFLFLVESDLRLMSSQRDLSVLKQLVWSPHLKFHANSDGSRYAWRMPFVCFHRALLFLYRMPFNRLRIQMRNEGAHACGKY